MRRRASEQRARFLGAKSFRDARRGLQSDETETRHEQWMMRDEADGAEDLVVQLGRVFRERRHQCSISLRVFAQALGMGADGLLENRGRAVVERMRERDR